MTVDPGQDNVTAPYETWRRWKGCDRKIPYTSQWVARNAAIAWSWNGHPMDVYGCRYCGQWHLTSRKDGAA